MPTITRHITHSSAIEMVGHDTVTGELLIRFKDKGQYPTYMWADVPEDLVIGLLIAPSMGSYYHSYIKDSQYTITSALGSYRLAAIARRTSNVATEAVKGVAGRLGKLFGR